METVLITGVAGLLGSHLADRLLEIGHKVIGIDNFSGGYKDNVPHGVKFFYGDCSNLDFLNEVVAKDVDVIYHTACTAYEGLSVFSPSIITQNTFGNSISVFSSAISNNCRRVVFCSSMARYGQQPETPFREDMIPLPQDPYGISKLAAERVLQELSDTHGIEYAIAVPHNIIGPRQKYDDPFRNVVAIMINLMLQNRQPVIYGDGSQTRCFSYVSDVVDPLVSLGFDPRTNSELINVGPDEGELTINELAEQIADLLNFNLSPIYLPARPREVHIATCSSDKARKLLGYQPQTDLVGGIKALIAYIKDRGPLPFNYHLPVEISNHLTPTSWTKQIF